MATYTWYKYEIKETQEGVPPYTDTSQGNYRRLGVTPTQAYSGSTSYNFDATTGQYSQSGYISDTTLENGASYPYVVIASANNRSLHRFISLEPLTTEEIESYGGTHAEVYEYRKAVPAYYTTVYSAGSFLEEVTSDNINTYPTDGQQDGYWYRLNSAPTTPGVPTFTSDIVGGDRIKILWAASTDDYSSIIRYELQTSYNGEEWTTIYTTRVGVKDNCQLFHTIPKDTVSIAYRVRAFDSSAYSNYATSATVNVRPMPSSPGQPVLPDNYKEINPVTISWKQSTIINGDILTYELQARIDGQDWIDIYSGSSSNTLYSIPIGAKQIAFRVRTYSAAGVYTEYTRSNSFILVNLAPTSLGAQPVGTIVKLNVNGYPTNFIVVHQGNPDPSIYDASCDGTWLLMEDIYDKQYTDSNGFIAFYYLDTLIAHNVSCGFETLFDDDIQSAIKQVSIPYVSQTSTSSTTIDNYSTKIFLLSGTELGYPESTNLSIEGASLDYFNEVENSTRIANFNGEPTEYYTRSIASNMVLVNNIWVVDTTGSIKAFDMSADGRETALGIRPALILPSTLFVSDNGSVMIENPSIVGNVTVEGVQKTLTGDGYINIDGVWKSLVTSYGNINGLYVPIKPIYKWEKYALASILEHEMYLDSSETSVRTGTASTIVTYASDIIFNKTTGDISLSNPTATTIELYYTNNLYNANKYLIYEGVLGQVNSVTYNVRTGYTITYYKVLSQKISDTVIGNFIEYTTAFDKSSYPANAPFTDGYWYKKCFDIMPLPTMTINNVVYEFEPGMTWYAWTKSQYNTGYNGLHIGPYTNYTVRITNSDSTTVPITYADNLSMNLNEQLVNKTVNYQHWIYENCKYSVDI